MYIIGKYKYMQKIVGLIRLERVFVCVCVEGKERQLQKSAQRCNDVTLISVLSRKGY